MLLLNEFLLELNWSIEFGFGVGVRSKSCVCGVVLLAVPRLSSFKNILMVSPEMGLDEIKSPTERAGIRVG